MSLPDDHTLLQEFCASRSEIAFTRLVQRHLPLVYHAALRRLAIPALAEEAAQNAFTRLAVKISSVARHPDRLRAWLHRTAFLEACTIARKETRLARLPAAPEPEAMNRPELYDRLDEALNRLPELDRELLLRRCCEGEDFRRIAAATGKSEAACQKRVERALLRLGQTLGATGSTTVLVTALSANSSGAVPLPPAERVAAAALREIAAGAGAGAAGALSGLAVAACMAATLAGGALGWQREETVPSSSAAAPELKSTPKPESAGSTPAATALLPRPPRTPRSRDEVLESIQAGRIGPFIEFLPHTTVADLLAIIREGDLEGLGEGSGSRSWTHWLALDRWAEMDPAGAFAYGVIRDREGYGANPVAARMLAKWMKVNAGAALQAFAALPHSNRASIAWSIVSIDDALASRLLEAHPDLLWDVERERLRNPPPERQDEEAERTVAAAVAGEKPTTAMPPHVIIRAFLRLAQRDSAGTLARAALIPDSALRAQVIVHLHDSLPQAAASLTVSLPPGVERARAVARNTLSLMSANPDTVINRLKSAPPGAERDAIFQAVSQILAANEPWRLLETVVSLRGSLGFAEGRLNPGTYSSNGSSGSSRYLEGMSWDNHLERALYSAGRDNPRRALSMIPDLAARMHASVSPDKPVLGMVSQVLSGWLEKDTAGAIAWLKELPPAERQTIVYSAKLKTRSPAVSNAIQSLTP